MDHSDAGAEHWQGLGASYVWSEGGGVYGNCLHFPLNFAANLKLIYKIKSIKKKQTLRGEKA